MPLIFLLDLYDFSYFVYYVLQLVLETTKRCYFNTFSFLMIFMAFLTLKRKLFLALYNTHRTQLTNKTSCFLSLQDSY